MIWASSSVGTVYWEQASRWGCGGEGRREKNESLFVCLWEVAFLVPFYKMLTLSRFMCEWYPNKSHSWRNHLGASTGSSLSFSLEVTSSSSHQSNCRWQQHPGSGWCCFPGCPSALTLFPAPLCQATLLCRAEGLLKSQQRLPSLAPVMQKSLNSSLLTNYD